MIHKPLSVVALPPLSADRRFTPREFAFVRSWAEGLEGSAAWKRYGSGAGERDDDGRAGQRELQGLLDDMRAQARAWGRPDLAVLLRLDPRARAGGHATPPPSLEEFRQRLPADYYSEAEVLALYLDQAGPAATGAPLRRRQRRRHRLLLALQWLERQDGRRPQRSDPVADWFEPPVARRLVAAGMPDLDGLMLRVAGRGFRWYRTVPRLGPVGAARVLAWLRAQAPSLGTLPAWSAQPERRLDKAALTPSPRCGIVPLERFCPPTALDGSAGRFRAPAGRCSLAAASDVDAVQAWLARWQPGSHTWRAYRKEAERLLLWAVLERGRALSSLDADDGRAYLAFLTAPGDDWRAARRTPRWSDDWRPFEGPLAQRSRTLAFKVLRAMYTWLASVGYLVVDPWQGLGARLATAEAPPSPAPARPPAPPPTPLRALSAAQWASVQRWVGRMPPSAAQRRWRFMARLAAATGLRPAELSAATLGWLQPPSPGTDGIWSIVVPGPGARARRLPVPAIVMEDFRECLTDRQLAAPILSNDPKTALIGRLDGPEGLSTSRLYEVLTDGFRRCAADLATADPMAAARIGAASAGWLRHTFGMQATSAGMPQAALQAALGHEQAASSAIYSPARGTRPAVAGRLVD